MVGVAGQRCPDRIVIDDGRLGREMVKPERGGKVPVQRGQVVGKAMPFVLAVDFRVPVVMIAERCPAHAILQALSFLGVLALLQRFPPVGTGLLVEVVLVQVDDVRCLRVVAQALGYPVALAAHGERIPYKDQTRSISHFVDFPSIRCDEATDFELGQLFGIVYGSADNCLRT